MRISRDKINVLSHTVADTLAGIDAVTFREDRNTIRLEALQTINNLMAQEAAMDQAARTKIESQTRPIPEGSSEWDILYKKYYEEELQRLTGKSVGRPQD